MTLPRTFRFDEATGKPKARVAAAYRELWEAACELYEWWSYVSYEQQVEAGHLPTPEVMPERPALAERDENWMIETALAALAVNYRIGPVELNTLAEVSEVLTNAVVMQMTLALFDRQIEAEYWQKKTLAAAGPVPGWPPSSPGEPVGSPSIAPASAN